MLGNTRWMLIQLEDAAQKNKTNSVGKIVLEQNNPNGFLEYIFENGFEGKHYEVQQDEYSIKIGMFEHEYNQIQENKRDAEIFRFLTNTVKSIINKR